jgi:cytochrome c553
MPHPRSSLAAAGLCATFALATVACGGDSRTADSTPAASQPAAVASQAASSPVERGKYLVTVGGCNDCHSPKTFGPNGPQPDTSRLLSGHPENAKIDKSFVPPKGSPWAYATTSDMTAWGGPWGVSFAANLTPDTNTGLRSGVWTEDLFIKALRSGKHMGTSRDILPPMPWPEVSQLTDDDLKAIWAYLGTIPPVINHVPDPIPPAGGTR